MTESLPVVVPAHLQRLYESITPEEIARYAAVRFVDIEDPQPSAGRC